MSSAGHYIGRDDTSAEPTRKPLGIEGARDGVLSVDRLSKLPAVEHLAVLVEKPFSGPDGYGGTEYGHLLEYLAFESEKALEGWILAATKRNDVFRILRTKKLSYTVHASISLEA
jgi:hypothetical protein